MKIRFQMNFNEYSNYLNNKSIAIIGPAPSVKNELFNEDDYDIIIRINKQCKKEDMCNLSQYIGTRTDILYNCLNKTSDCGGELDINYLENNIKYVVCPIKYDNNNKDSRDHMFFQAFMSNCFYHFHIRNENRLKFIVIDNEYYDKLDELANTRINTGLLAVMDIMRYNFKKLYVKGFTFFLDGYLLEYRNTINGQKCDSENNTINKVKNFMDRTQNHNQELQWALFKTMLNESTKNIVLDKSLETIMNLDVFPSENESMVSNDLPIDQNKLNNHSFQF